MPHLVHSEPFRMPKTDPIEQDLLVLAVKVCMAVWAQGNTVVGMVA